MFWVLFGWVFLGLVGKSFVLVLKVYITLVSETRGKTPHISQLANHVNQLVN